MAATVIEGRYLLVGYPGLPAKEWVRVLHYKHPNGLYRPVEPIAPAAFGWGWIADLLIVDPLTRQRWVIPAGGRSRAQPPGTTG